MSRLAFFNLLDTGPILNEQLELYRVIGKTTPVIIYYKTGKITELENLVHDSDTSNYLNSRGLDIYLYEPLTGYKKNVNNTCPFYTEYSGSEQLDEYYAHELDSIVVYIKNNNLKKVTVHACDYNIEKYYGYNYKNLNMINDNIFIETMHNHVIDIPYKKVPIEKKFICLTWRYTHHRHLISSFLADKSAYLSWFYKKPIEWGSIPYITNFDDYSNLLSKIEKGSEILMSGAPWCLDVDMIDSDVVDNKKSIPEYSHYVNTATMLPTYSDYYFHRSFCAIVGETRFAQPTGDITEKTFKCILFNTPFILVAPPKSLEYLKSFGYKTFNHFWDESYDDETNHYKRLVKILSIIDKLDELNIDELTQMKDAMMPILEFNKNLFLEQKMSVINKVANYTYKRNRQCS